MEQNLSRRSVFKIVVVAGVSAPLVSMPDAAHAESQFDAIVGKIREVHADRISIDTSDGVFEVVPYSNARMYSGIGGEVSSIEHFQLGDRVAVQGARTARKFAASGIGSVFEKLSARVISVNEDGSVAETDIGPIELTKGRLPFTTDSEQSVLHGPPVRPGTRLDGLGWVAPSTGQQYLLVQA